MHVAHTCSTYVQCVCTHAHVHAWCASLCHHGCELRASLWVSVVRCIVRSVIAAAGKSIAEGGDPVLRGVQGVGRKQGIWRIAPCIRRQHLEGYSELSYLTPRHPWVSRHLVNECGLYVGVVILHVVHASVHVAVAVATPYSGNLASYTS